MKLPPLYKLGVMPAEAASEEGRFARRLEELREKNHHLEAALVQLQGQRDALRAENAELQHSRISAEATLRELEKLMEAPERAYNAMLYYHLRALWAVCHREVEGLAHITKNRYENIELSQRKQEWERDRETRLEALQAQLERISDEERAIAARVERLEQELEARHTTWHRFRRKPLEEQLAGARTMLGAARERLKDTVSQLDQVRSEEADRFRFPGLSVKARRAINLAVIAAAQELYISFNSDNVPELVRRSRENSPAQVRFGSGAECLRIIKHIEELRLSYDSDAGRMGRIRARMNFLSTSFRYDNAEAALPDLRSVNSVAVDPGQVHEEHEFPAIPVPVNVVDMNCWGIKRFLVV